ncbi:hypothetical protein LguiA_035553 [Lonicera macranthoides]
MHQLSIDQTKPPHLASSPLSMDRGASIYVQNMICSSNYYMYSLTKSYLR